MYGGLFSGGLFFGLLHQTEKTRQTRNIKSFCHVQFTSLNQNFRYHFFHCVLCDEYKLNEIFRF